jgi:hypothetical protein
MLPLLRACCEWHYLSYAATVSTRSRSFDLLAQLPFSRPLIYVKASNATW